MSLQFNDTTNYKGLVQIYEKECGYNQGDVSGSTALLKAFTADANLALDDFFSIAFSTNGTWKLDDSGHTTYPIVTTALVSGQRDYSFLTDSSSNLILDIRKAFVRVSATGPYKEISPVDVESEDSDTLSFADGQNASGVPTRYDKLGNGIFLDLIPNYNSTDGLKVYVDREPSYFVYTDTTKKPGVPGLLHRYFAVKPAMDFARTKGKANYNALALEVARLEKLIGETFAQRTKDEPSRMSPRMESNK